MNVNGSHKGEERETESGQITDRVGHVKWSRSRGGDDVRSKERRVRSSRAEVEVVRKRSVGDDAWQDKVMQANASFDLDYLFQDGR